MNENNKIAIVITGMSFGGAERVTAYLSNYFVSCNKDIYLISLTKTEPAYPLAGLVHYIQLDPSESKNPLVRYRALIKQIRNTIKKIQPSLVLGMMSYSGSLTAFACAGLKIPILLSERNDPNTTQSFSNLEKKVIRFAYHKFAYRAVFQTESAKTYYYRRDSFRGVVIPNPLYLEDLPSPNTGINNTMEIMSAGRLSKQKNQQLLIKAFFLVHEKHPQCTLTIYGEGDQRMQLEQLISSLHLESSVSLPGIESSIFPKLQKAHMFVMSSNFEGMPNALIEAMAMGLPVVTTDYSEGRGTLVINNKNGLVVPRFNEKALAEAMLFIIENPKLAFEMSRNALCVRNELDSRQICKKWLDTIEETITAYK
ncbi:glycosyltransferase [Sphaerochaeta pleomorpha str. Grapes]|uniref:Glycosyltransferase n=1 Tax=Sphaerochaeta pleomorpha (strain ATCC BAA-1885 / DSM 22778 / Grapes) TaxID=158190 RepID=G8QVT2_SPHPG|nr:glycosyltransferase [Sphaerochaeta pleomorpha]AEV29374.1 glycosyltransferase [Sphaerochaeta pleomorpha str. Grapes]